jgi:hypothetical protein
LRNHKRSTTRNKQSQIKSKSPPTQIPTGAVKKERWLSEFDFFADKQFVESILAADPKRLDIPLSEEIYAAMESHQVQLFKLILLVTLRQKVLLVLSELQVTDLDEVRPKLCVDNPMGLAAMTDRELIDFASQNQPVIKLNPEFIEAWSKKASAACNKGEQNE